SSAVDSTDETIPGSSYGKPGVGSDSTVPSIPTRTASIGALQELRSAYMTWPDGSGDTEKKAPSRVICRVSPLDTSNRKIGRCSARPPTKKTADPSADH